MPDRMDLDAAVRANLTGHRGTFARMSWRVPAQRIRDAERARELRALGLTHREIGSVLGYARSTIGELLAEPETGAGYIRRKRKHGDDWRRAFPASQAEPLRQRRRRRRTPPKDVVKSDIISFTCDEPTDPTDGAWIVKAWDAQDPNALIALEAGDNLDDALLDALAKVREVWP
jgi:hypothetical protein